MSTRDCNDVLKKIDGINFPKHVRDLRESKKYWKEYDDFHMLPPDHLLVAEAQKDKWCVISTELVDGKLPPGARRPIKPNRTSPSSEFLPDIDFSVGTTARPYPLGAPSGPRSNRTGDALDYAAYEAPPPPPPSRASRASATEPRPGSRERRPRSTSRTPRVDVKIVVPVVFPDKVVPPVEGEQNPGGGMSSMQDDAWDAVPLTLVSPCVLKREEKDIGG